MTARPSNPFSLVARTPRRAARTSDAEAAGQEKPGIFSALRGQKESASGMVQGRYSASCATSRGGGATPPASSLPCSYSRLMTHPSFAQPVVRAKAPLWGDASLLNLAGCVPAHPVLLGACESINSCSALPGGFIHTVAINFGSVARRGRIVSPSRTVRATSPKVVKSECAS